jgi:hypothetical protein
MEFMGSLDFFPPPDYGLPKRHEPLALLSYLSTAVIGSGPGCDGGEYSPEGFGKRHEVSKSRKPIAHMELRRRRQDWISQKRRIPLYTISYEQTRKPKGGFLSCQSRVMLDEWAVGVSDDTLG